MMLFPRVECLSQQIANSIVRGCTRTAFQYRACAERRKNRQNEHPAIRRRHCQRTQMSMRLKPMPTRGLLRPVPTYCHRRARRRSVGMSRRTTTFSFTPKSLVFAVRSDHPTSPVRCMWQDLWLDRFRQRHRTLTPRPLQAGTVRTSRPWRNAGPALLSASRRRSCNRPSCRRR